MRNFILFLTVLCALAPHSQSHAAASAGTVVTIAGNGQVGFSGDGGPATNAALNGISGLAFGPDRTLYISDEGNLRIRAVDPATGLIRTIAGTGVTGDEGNDGPATSANLGGVIGLATDRARNVLYLTDWANNFVRKVNLTDGIITRFAGSGNFGMNGQGGPATLAELAFPVDAATDGAGRLSFVDSHNNRICRVDPATGIISTIAGGPGLGPTGDGGPATSAALGNAIRLAADPAGNVFVRDGDPNGTFFMVRRIDATTGIITTIVGGGSNPEGTGVATSMMFKNIGELAANDAGALFLSTSRRVFKLNIATGIIAPFAGDGTSGFGNEGDPALTAKFANITSLAVAPDGGLVIGDSDNARIRYIAPTAPPVQPATSSGSIITIAGTTHGYSGDGGPATGAKIGDGVWAIDFGPDGTLYFADFNNARIRAIDPVTGVIRTVAGNGNLSDDSGDGGPATNASIGTIYGLAVDRARHALYLADDGKNRVRKIDLNTGIISAYAGKGLGGIGAGGDGGPAVEAELAFPKGLAVNDAGHLMIADTSNYRIRAVDPITRVISKVAGQADFWNTHCSNAGDGGLAVNADFSLPTQVSVDGAGNIFVFDSGGPCGTANPPTTIRRIDSVTGIITRVAGGGTTPLGSAGIATDMDLAPVYSHTVDRAGNVYFATYTRIFKVDPANGLVSVFAGTGIQGFSGDGGPAVAAQFGRIFSLAPAPGGGLVVDDSGNARLRYIAPPSINLTGDIGQTSFTLPWGKELSGNLILENNTNLTAVNLAGLTSVSGDLVLGGNTAAGTLDLGSLESAGTVSVTGNTAAGVLDLGSLEATSGNLIITDNTATTVIDLASLTSVSGDLVLTNNGASGDLDLGSLGTVSGDLTIEEPASGNLDLGSLEQVSGDLTLESNESGNLDLSTLTEYGCIATNEVTMTLDGSFAMTNGITLCTNATLAGNASVDGSITNNGTIEPGSSPGRLSITRDLHLGATSRLNLEIGGYAPTQIDTINVGGSAVLGGVLKIRLLDTFTNVMTNGASFTVLTSAQPLTGAFANVASGSTLTTEDGRARFTVNYAGQNNLRLTDLQILTDPAPELRILSINNQSGALRIIWTAVPGTTYRVQSAANLQDAFTDQSPSITAGSNDTALQYEVPTPVETTGFFIVRTTP